MKIKKIKKQKLRGIIWQNNIKDIKSEEMI